MKVDIWSDVACPFCYLGKTTLDSVLQEFPQRDDVEVTYHSFVLNPALPVEPTGDLYDYLSARVGASREQVIAMNDQLAAKAADVGLHWNMDKVIPTNTTDAHRLLHYAAAHGKQQQLKDRLLQAFFSDGLNIGKHEVLIELAAEVGLDAAEVKQVLASDKFAQEVQDDIAAAQGLGISGVPFYVINGKYGISGAQPALVFKNALQQAWSDEHPQPLNDDMGEACELPKEDV